MIRKLLHRSTVLPAICALVLPGLHANVKFNETFAPTLGYVKPAEAKFRQDLCLSGNWQFQPVPLPEGFREGFDAAPALPAVDPAKWAAVPVRVPSPWNVNSFADKDGQGGDFRTYPGYPKEWEDIKMGWLKRTVNVPANWQGHRILLRFEAVAGKAEIKVNGQDVGSHFEIFLPFELDVTDAIKFGEENEILVGLRKPSLFDDRKGDKGRRTYQGGSFWGQHIVGIWQDAFLVAVPQVRVTDVFVQPQVAKGTLVAEVTLQNDTDSAVTASVEAKAFPWISKAGKDVLTAPLPSAELGAEAALSLPAQSISIPANGTATVTLQAPVKNKLELWAPGSPNLYGLVVGTSANGKPIDSKYTRFGWREVTIEGSKVLLNGKELSMKGDSWHFLGIPQMTRRYPWAWFTAARDANINAVRLHAQPYPSFYLDVADEMGMLILDETAVWASDGGPKLDDPVFWETTRRDLETLIKRDRNHPSIFGWSVSNEVHPIVKGVMKDPPGMMETLNEHYKLWADICRKFDPTRPWISADGEDDGDGQLPAYVIHYGGLGAMDRGVNSGKPWGIGEAGKGYYGTPEQVAEDGGERAYESFEGRMEGVAIGSFESILAQHDKGASYRSVFNLAWYGLKPLPLGMSDVTRPPTLEDGVFFTKYVEGQPGVQPERLGPYCTTLNPGYDPSLPLYETWALFDAIRDASADPPVKGQWSTKPTPEPEETYPAPAPITSAKVLGGEGSKLAFELTTIGVPVPELEKAGGVPQLLFIDGVKPPAESARAAIEQVLKAGGTVVVWGAESSTLGALNKLLPAALELTKREASSLLPVGKSPVIAGMKPSTLYFSELHPSTVTETGLAGPLIEKSKVLLKDNDTDWTLWNKQPEYAKTAMIVRSEREAKPSGVVLAEAAAGKGRLLITTLPSAPRIPKAEQMDRTFLANLGIQLGAGMDEGKPLLKTGMLVRALATGYFPVASMEEGGKLAVIDPKNPDVITEGATIDGKPVKKIEEESGTFEINNLDLPGFQPNVAAYLSFWVYSPRPLDNLLLEPNMPVVNLEVAQNDSVQAWVNGKQVIDKIRTGPMEGGTAVSEPLELQQGWNHVLIKLVRAAGGWNFTAKLVSSQPEFLTLMDSALVQP